MMVDIYIREKSGKREIRIPLIPEEIVFQSGDATVISYEIMGLGEVAIPSGTELGKWGWKSEFPGFNRQDDPMIRGTWYEASDYDRVLKDWKEKGTELNLLVTGYPINADVYLKRYHASAAGAFGDIAYEIEFFEARSIVVTATKDEQTAATTRPASASSTYTIKKGDTLWAIAKKFYDAGSKWKTIYDANKDIIEKTAKKHGKKSSDNGHWIYPGVTLTIPGVSGSSSSKSGSSSSSSSKKPTSSTKEETTSQKAEAYTAQRNSTLSQYVSRLKVKGTDGVVRLM